MQAPLPRSEYWEEVACASYSGCHGPLRDSQGIAESRTFVDGLDELFFISARNTAV